MNTPTRRAATPTGRRRQTCLALVFLLGGANVRIALATAAEHPKRRWFEAAEAMRQLALSGGDQSYGAILVLGGTVVGEGPSRVIRNSDPDAHAEREAIRDAQRRLGVSNLAGSVLYSTSRPCRLCEAAAAEANVARMYFGPGLVDAGAPRR